MADKHSECLMRKTLQVTTRLFGKEKAIYGCTAAGDRLVLALLGSSNLLFYSKTGELEEFQVQVPGCAIQDFALNGSGTLVGLLLKDKVVVASTTPGGAAPITLSSDIGTPTCLAWSANSEVLAVGTNQGGLLLFHLRSGKKTNVAGKHAKKVVKMVWSAAGLLASRGEDDTVQVTRESGEPAEEFAEGRKQTFTEVDQCFWLEHSLLVDRVHGPKKGPTDSDSKKASRYQLNLEKLKNKGSQPSGTLPAEAPRPTKLPQVLLAVSQKAGKELCVLAGTEGSVLRVPLQQTHGRVVSAGCSPSGDLLVGTSRGFLLRFGVSEGGFVEMQAERVFANQMEFCLLDTPPAKLLLCGDNGLRVFDAKSLREEREFRLNFDKNFGAPAALLASRSGGLVFVASTGGLVHGFTVQSEQKARLFPRYFTVQASPCEIVLRPLEDKSVREWASELETSPALTMTFPGAEIVDFVVLQNKIVVAQRGEVSCYLIVPGEPTALWKVPCASPVEGLMPGEQNYVLVRTAAELRVLDVQRPTAARPPIPTARFPLPKMVFFDSFLAILSRGQLTIFDTATTRQLASVTLPGDPAALFVNEKTFEFFLWDPSRNCLVVYRGKFDRPAEEIPLPEKTGLSALLFDAQNPGVFCTVFENGKVFGLCKRGNHFKAPSAFRFLREILRPSDLEESEKGAELAVTLVDPSITPLRLSDGYLFCLEKGVAPTGCFLSSHSYKLGSLESLKTDTLSPAAEPPSSRAPVDDSEAFLETPDSRPTAVPVLSESEREYFLKAFFQTVELGLFVHSAKAADALAVPALWALLAETALKNCALELAQVCYQRLGNWSMAYCLQALIQRRPSALQTKAEIAVILCDYDFAKTCYLKLERPDLAVDLLVNLHEFAAAADLCKTYALEDQELAVRFQIAEVDLKNEDFIKAEGGLESILRRLSGHPAVAALARSVPSDRPPLNSKSSIRVGKENQDSHINLPEKDLPEDCATSCPKKAVTGRSFNVCRLFRQTVSSLAGLFIRQGSLLKANETIAQLPADATEELTELAQTAFEAGQFAMASDLFQRVGCPRRELEARLQLVLKAPGNSKQAVADFGRLVASRLASLGDSVLLLSLAEFFQDKDVQLADKLLRKAGVLAERVRFAISVLGDFGLAERIFDEAGASDQQSAGLLADFLSGNQSLVCDSRTKAVRFLLLAGRKMEALKLSFEIDAVDLFCRHVQHFDDAEAQTLARFYVSKGRFDQAGKFFVSSGQYERALLSFVKAKDFDSAIDLVFQLHDEDLFDLMVQIFAGETVIAAHDRGFEAFADAPGELFELVRNPAQATGLSGKNRLDGIPEPVDPIYLFKLYLRFGKVDQANTIALAIVDRELIDGSYRSAFLHTCTIRSMLAKARARVTGELRNKIVVLHSYVLVKKALKHENHLLAALLLNRVCSFLHYLPKNDTDILTSAVIEATKSGLRATAYNWALTLCKPQHRSQINPKLKEKIEKIALKPVASDQKTEHHGEAGWLPVDPRAAAGPLRCPCCNGPALDAFALACAACFNNFQVCIATGKAVLCGPHTTFLRCRSCWGVAYEPELRALLSKEGECPGCEAKEAENFEGLDFAEIATEMKGGA